MAAITEALRGFGYRIHVRDGFRCVYCGLDGTESLANWLALGWDHLLPPGDPCRDDSEFIVTACRFCSEAADRLVERADLPIRGTTRDQLIARRLPYVRQARDEYERFWHEKVLPAMAHG